MIESIDKSKHLHTHVHLCIANFQHKHIICDALQLSVEIYERTFTLVSQIPQTVLKLI